MKPIHVSYPNSNAIKLKVIVLALILALPFSNCTSLAQSSADIEVIHHGSFEPLPGHVGHPRLADVFEPGHPCILSEDLPDFPNLPANFKVYTAIPEIPTGVSKWYTITDSVDLLTPGPSSGIIVKDGQNLIDLIGTPGLGALNQKIDTVPGRNYIVNFCVTSNQSNENNPTTSDRLFTFFWQGEGILFPTSAPVMNTYDRFTYILQAPEDPTGEVVQIGWGGWPSPSARDDKNRLLFGVFLDEVSVVLVRAFPDTSTVNENEDFHRITLFPLENDSGIDDVVGALILDCSANIPPEMCGSIVNDGFPNDRLRWETSDGEPISFDFLQHDETGTIRIRYFTETERGQGRNGMEPPVEVADQAIWTITIIGSNDPPVAEPDCAETVLNQEVSIAVLANDNDVDDGIDVERIDIVEPPINGDVFVEQDGTITYTPNNLFDGSDFFEYRVCDPFGAFSNTVRVDVHVWLGDVNGDGIVDLLDVAGFVFLLQTGGYQVQADINRDGKVNLLDIGPFVDLLSGSQCDL